ncbi:MAG TPA: RNA polymerase sigma factor [Myxococcota bacterium]|nr:RNA polymerase sigma factor [Myxococcota bacterium]HRY92834.1 RNA polymerase sigma factor [Myxococcota bacterium]HSA20279.1 RNA polymerase sigma factor [Myxococcota bacterium]
MKRDEVSELFAKHAPAVYRRARYLLGNAADADEATQEVFIRVLRYPQAWEERGQVTTWLYRITTNYCFNRIRDRRRRRELWEEHGCAQPDGPRGAPSAEDLTEIRKVLAVVDESCAAAAIYVLVDGMSHEEAAEILGVSRRTVGNLLDRFRKQSEALTAPPGTPPEPGGCPDPGAAG